jgi:hypothetical protein
MALGQIFWMLPYHLSVFSGMDGGSVLRISSKVKAAPQRGAPPHHRTSASVAGIKAMSCGALWDSTTALNDIQPKYREAPLDN